MYKLFCNLQKMKKTINIILLLLLTFVLSSCFTSQDDVNKAKQNLWIIDWTVNDSWNNLEDEINKAKEKLSEVIEHTVDDVKEEIVNQIERSEEVQKIEIRSISAGQFLELDDLSSKDLLSWEVEITWKTLNNVDKIVVTFKNETSDFPDDEFELKKFSSWDETFLYRAFSRYETLDYGKNIYVFKAFAWDIVTELELTINVTKEEEKEISEKTEKIYEDIIMWELPSNEKFGTPTELWNGKISYSDLNWLEIKRDVRPKLSCETVTSTLADSISGYFYWNTCRPVLNDEWISFFVVRLDWDNYIYEKHYYLSYTWLYWIQELETWTWVTKVNIWEKNTELKKINDNFGILEITDELFKEILK